MRIGKLWLVAILSAIPVAAHAQVNIGVNVGKAAGQSRMHVHVHLIPRYAGDAADPAGGVRCVLPKGSV